MSVPAQGGSPRQIASVPPNTIDLAASRDGRRLALISNRKLTYPQQGSIRSIYLFRPGHGLLRLRSFRTNAPLDIAISPDGERIAFGMRSEIWLMRSDGGGIRQATDGRSVAWDPAFTPDGGSLVFDRDADGGPANDPQLFRKRLSGGTEVQLSEDQGRNPTISSKGLLLYTRLEEGATDSRLVAMHLDGSSRRTVERYNDPFFDVAETFSPDGRSFAYLRLWEKNGYAVNYRYSIHIKTVTGARHRKVVGGIRSSARRAPFAGHAPAGPAWVPW
jgi:dipeptidyl aminopeptidase/acylaminoacyl peptidase